LGPFVLSPRNRQSTRTFRRPSSSTWVEIKLQAAHAIDATSFQGLRLLDGVTYLTG
jgi:hypothetical protein